MSVNKQHFAVYLHVTCYKQNHSKHIAILETFMELTNFIETKVNEYAQKIIKGGEKSDDLAFGQLSFYLSLR